MGVRSINDKFQARITVNGKMLHLGCYATASKAAKIYTAARRLHFGEWA